MRLVNISNRKRLIYLFCRDEQGNQIIEKDESFFPYYYELDPNGKFKSFDGKRLRKVFCNEPAEVAKVKTKNSYEADIIYPKRYLIDRVDTIDPCPYRYIFLDIEVLSKEFPDFKNPKAPISCVSIYDSFSKNISTWYIGDMPGSNLEQQEDVLLAEVIAHIRLLSPDLFIGHNVYFDYNYLDARNDMFAQRISPIGRVRMGDHANEIFYPAGISIVDYLTLFKKVYMREQSYALDQLSQKHLGEAPWQEMKYGELTPDIKEKNINDIQRLIKLEDKFKLLSYFDEIRRLSKCQWEDFCVRMGSKFVSGNSRIVEMILFEEAKKQKVILPNKPRPDVTDDEVEFEGAFRDVFELGVHEGCAKLDLGSAYPQAILNFCLDSMNICSDGDGVKIGPTIFAQNPNALLPSVIKRLLTLKDKRKEELKLNPKDDQLKVRYDAIKAIVNSAFGVTGQPYFRLFNLQVASAITFLIRDLLHYVKEHLEKEGHKILYVDTDSIFCDTKNDISELCNNLVQKWGQEKYNKENVLIKFEYEGYFEKLLLLKKCRYLGYLNTGKGVKEEIKGLETKRSDSSKFMATFQRRLIDKVLNKESKSSIIKWVVEEAERMKTLPLEEIGFPCKVGKDEEEYKNTPIFMRALAYAEELNVLNKVKGELFYYIYINATTYEEEFTEEYYYREKTSRTLKSGKIKEGSKKVKVTKKAYEQLDAENREKILIDKVSVKKPKNVIAFDKYNKEHVKDIDWSIMIARNISNKVETLFEALGWDKEVEKLAPQLDKVKECI